MSLPKSLINEVNDRLEVPIEYLLWLDEERAKINRKNLDKIDFTENNKTLEFSDNIKKYFRWTGLSNIDFILTDFYKSTEKDWLNHQAIITDD